MTRYAHPTVVLVSLALLLTWSLAPGCERTPDDANTTTSTTTDDASATTSAPADEVDDVSAQQPTTQPDTSADDTERSPEALAILRSARDVCLAATSARYTFDIEGTLALRMIPRMQGNALLSRVVDTWDSMIYVYTEMAADPSAPNANPAVYLVASDGTIITGLSDRTMLYYEGTVAEGGPDIIPSLGGNGLARPFIDKAPFEKELAAPVVRLIGEEMVDDVVCDIIEVEMPGEDPDKVRWAIGREMSLPRRHQAVYPGDENEDSTFTLTLRDLVINVPVDPSMFYVEPRQGYELYTFVTPVPNGSPVPDWTLKTPDGEDVSSSDFEDQIVLLYFWKCESMLSRAQLPELEWLRQEYEGPEVKVIAVSFAEREGDDPVSHARAQGWEGTTVVGGDDLADALGVPVVPTLVIVDRDQTMNVMLPRFRADKRQFLQQTIRMLLE